MPAVIAITLFLLYTLSAWVMLRSVKNPRLEPIAWILILITIVGHGDAIIHMMRLNARFSIGLLEAMSLLGWILAALACLISIDKHNRVIGAILMLSAAVGAAVGTGVGGVGRSYAEATAGWELTAHILLSMGAAALLFAAAVTAILLVILDGRLRARRIAEHGASVEALAIAEDAAGFQHDPLNVAHLRPRCIPFSGLMLKESSCPRRFSTRSCAAKSRATSCTRTTKCWRSSTLRRSASGTRS